MAEPTPAPTLFISYSHDDAELKDRLLVQLGVLESQGLLDVWTDDRIQTGDPWRDEIARAMDGACIAVLLVSASFLGSRFVRDEEIPCILERRLEEGMRVFPIVVRPCAWQSVEWLERLQVLDLSAAGSLDAGLAEVVREIHQRLAPAPAEGGGEPRKCLPPPPDRITLGRLPVTGGKVLGREAELRRLHEAWHDPDAHVVSVVGWGGAGKSALLNRWLLEMEDDGYGCAERVFAWSFARQGAGEMPSSGDGFVSAALAWFGDPDPAGGNAWEKGERLAYQVRAERTLLLLDGLEPLQVAAGPEAGRLKDQALQALLRELGAANAGGLCVVTSRIPVVDLLDYEPGSAWRMDLRHLTPEVGARVLRAYGAAGSEEELMQASREFDGHPLTLVLLAGYLRDAFDGDIAQRGDLQLRHAGGQAERVMAAYEAWFGEGPELELLRLLGLFDRPADAPALAALRAPPAIAGLTGTLHRLPPPRWRQLVSQLRRTGLVADEDPEHPGELDVHPLVREHFREQTRLNHPSAWREGNGRLYEYFRSEAPPLPGTLPEMEPLFQAVAHGCEAGRHRDALHQVYLPRIMRGEEAYAARRLGASGALLSALAHFCHEGDWSRPVDPAPPEVQGLEPADQLEVLTQAGLYLTARKGYVADEQRICYDLVRQLAFELGQPVHLYHSLVAQYLEAVMMRETGTTLQLANEILALAQRLGAPPLLVGARRARCITAFAMGRHAEALAEAREGVRVWNEAGPTYPVDESYLGCRTMGALELWYLGFPEQARADMEETLRVIREEQDDPFLLATPGLFNSFYLAHERRRPAEALRFAEELAELSAAHGFLFWHAVGTTASGWALGITGEPERGLAIMETGQQQFAALGAPAPMAYTLSLQVELLSVLGRNAGALALVERALHLAERREEGRWMPEMHRQRGQLLLQMGAPAEAALGALTQARELAATQGSRMLELRALCSLVRAGAPRARGDLAALYAGFTEGWDELDLEEARALL